MGAGSTIILDGGMGRELQRAGAPFRQPEWSALALSEAPQAVEGCMPLISPVAPM